VQRTCHGGVASTGRRSAARTKSPLRREPGRARGPARELRVFGVVQLFFAVRPGPGSRMCRRRGGSDLSLVRSGTASRLAGGPGLAAFTSDRRHVLAVLAHGAAAFSPGLARLFRRKLVRRPFLMSRAPSHSCDLAASLFIHTREPATFSFTRQTRLLSLPSIPPRLIRTTMCRQVGRTRNRSKRRAMAESGSRRLRNGDCTKFGRRRWSPQQTADATLRRTGKEMNRTASRANAAGRRREVLRRRSS
jgi:hypothetical protein